jgi:hypothetical protein
MHLFVARIKRQRQLQRPKRCSSVGLGLSAEDIASLATPIACADSRLVAECKQCSHCLLRVDNMQALLEHIVTNHPHAISGSHLDDTLRKKLAYFVDSCVYLCHMCDNNGIRNQLASQAEKNKHEKMECPYRIPLVCIRACGAKWQNSPLGVLAMNTHMLDMPGCGMKTKTTRVRKRTLYACPYARYGCGYIPTQTEIRRTKHVKKCKRRPRPE